MKKRYQTAALLTCFVSLPLAAQEDFFELSLAKLTVAKVTVSSAFPEELLNSSSSVSLIERRQWQGYGSRTGFDVLQHMPSTMVYPSLGSGAIAIRGYAAGFSTVRGIATVLDGVPLNTLAFGAAQYDKANLGLETLDRIELIRGPSSSIYGSDAFHGVYASSSYRAEGSELAGSLDAGSDGFYQAGLRGGSLLAGSHQFSLAFSGSGLAAQGRQYDYTDPATGEPGRGEYDYRYDSQSLSMTLAGDIDASHWFYSAGMYLNNHEGDDFPGTGDLFGGSQQRDREHVDLDTRFEMFRGSLGYRWRSGIEAEFKQYYWQSELDHRLDFSRVEGVNREQLTRDNEHRRGSELQFRQSDGFANSDWFLSMVYDKTTIDENSQISSDGDSRSTKSAVLQVKSWLLDEQLALLYGGRVDDYSDIGNEATPRLGVIYRPDDYSAWKWLYGEAFRAPTAAEVDGVGVAAGSDNLEPETIATHELIYMYQRSQWRAEVVLFYSQWQDTIMLATNNQYQNFGESEARGLELIGEGSWQQWQLRGSVSYTESENTTEREDYDIFPEIIANADLVYRFESQALELTWSNRINYNADEGPVVSRQLPHYWRSDLQLAKDVAGGHHWSATVLNIFNRDNYFPSLWNTENGIEDKGITLQFGYRYTR